MSIQTAATSTSSSADTPNLVLIPPHVQQRLESNGPLPVLPWLAVRAVKISEDPDCSINEFVSLIERDVSLLSGILSFSNSAFYSGGKPIANVRQAVIRLGIRTCRNLILTSCISSLMGRMSMKQEWIRESLARHGYVTAAVCHSLNQRLQLGYDGEEFTAGLVHDIGRTILASCFSDEFQEFDALTFEESSATVDNEFSVIGTSHTEAGAYFAAKSGLPPVLIDVIRHHHTPDHSSGDRRLVALVAAADDIANHLQRFDSPENYDASTNKGLILLERLGVPNAIARISVDATEMLRDADTVAGNMAKL
jgi:putative nucleotidyltransferase with HDIG domain